MSRKNVFLYDIDVPEIVQKKAEEAFSMIKAEGETMVKKESTKQKYSAKKEEGRPVKNNRPKKQSRAKKRQMAGILSGMAACAAAAGIIIVLKGTWGRPAADMAKNGTETESIPDGGGKEENFLTTIDNMFTLQVQAAELEKEQPVPLIKSEQLPDNGSQINGEQAGSWVMGAAEDEVDYCINLPLSCTGNNIEKITYSINQGAFQIVQAEGESIVIDGQVYQGGINTGNVGQVGGIYEEETGLPLKNYETVFYRSFTLDYRKQSDEDTWINICNVLSDKEEIVHQIWGEGNSLEEVNRGMQGMLDNTIITCTVQYEDGTTQSADILVTSRIMTCAEAGAEVKEDPNREEIFITFELQG